MLPSQVLRNKVTSIDQKDYGAYQALLGEYDFENYHLIFKQIPKDPYAPPHTGIYRILLRRNNQKVVDLDVSTNIYQIASRDFLAPFWRRLIQALWQKEFDPANPELHASYLAIQLEAWEQVKQSIEAQREWTEQPILLHRSASSM